MTFDELVARCKCGVHLSVNGHRDVYDTVEEYLRRSREEDLGIDPADLARMIEANTIYELQFYPDTPIGFYTVYGLSLEEVLTKASEALR